MPTKVSVSAVRVRGLESSTTNGSLQAAANTLSETGSRSSKRWSLFSSSARPAGALRVPSISLALQNEHLTGTIFFPSTEIKRRAIQEKGTISGEIDDTFDGLTMLYAPNDVDLDICAVHGLGGNAFDTWTASTKMWLRDLLPGSHPFEKSRIMTFGYNSTVADKKSEDRLQDWADELLQQVGYVRISPEERERPIIFVCHSMGGLVGRHAMLRLNAQPAKFKGIKLEQCGLLFLSTPHYGTTQADWNTFLVSLCELTMGVRSHAIVEQLQSFNPSSVDSEEAFATMKKLPPYYCLCEGDRTKVLGMNRLIVTQASAGFHGRTADKILNVDHNHICKFETKFGGYMQVLDRLKRLREDLLGMDAEKRSDIQSFQAQPMTPGRPHATASHYPLALDSKYYEGNELRLSSELIGRSEEIENLTLMVAKNEQPASRIIAVTGIGGIGKTELLLELAFRFRNRRNVFYIRAHDPETLQDAFLTIATSIGHDVLSKRYDHAYLPAIWRGMSHSDRVQAFKAWLGDIDNQHSLFIVDDLDGLLSDIAIKGALPREAQLILYSTRNPSILQSLRGDRQELRVPTMDGDETATLLGSILRRSGSILSQEDFSLKDLKAIAKIVDGHALGAWRAVTYIIHVLAQTTEGPPARRFIDIFEGSDWESRMAFLEFKPRFELSLKETFEVSLQRLHQHKDAALNLLQLISFLSSTDKSLDFRKFLSVKRPWLSEFESEVPDREIFMNGLKYHGECLAELENVSIGFRPGLSGPLQLHPLWIESIRQSAHHQGRMRWLRQLLFLSQESWVRNEARAVIYPFVQNCIHIAAQFRISLDEICQSKVWSHWVEGSDSLVTDLASTSGQLTEVVPILQGPRRAYQAIRALRDSCLKVAELIVQDQATYQSEEKYSQSCSRFLSLLHQLKQFQDDYSVVHLGEEASQICVEIYDIFLSLAPFFQRSNPVLSDNLRNHRQKFLQSVRQATIPS